jgi:hypothetical protein
MRDYQPRPTTALPASQPFPEPIGRHVARARDDASEIDARAVSAPQLVAALGPR